LGLALPVRGEESQPSKAQQSDEVIARLEALLAAQQDKLAAQDKKIGDLEQLVSSAQQADVDGARIAEMKRQIREVLSEQEFRESLMPTTLQAGYDNGFFIRSTDDKFLIKLNGQMQFRYTYYNAQTRNHYLLPRHDRDDRSGFDIARMNLDLSGHVYTKDLTYFIELASGVGSSYDTFLSYAWANYRVVDELQFTAGLMRVAGPRSNFTVSNAQYQTVDAGLFDALYGLGDGIGVRIWGQLFNKKVEYYVDAVNNIGDQYRQTITNDEDFYTRGHDNAPAILARAVWHALEGTQRNPALASGAQDADLGHSLEPVLDLGMHYGFMNNYLVGSQAVPFTRQTFFQKGGFGLTNSTGMQFHQLGVDANLKYRGFSVTGEYAVRLMDVTAAADYPFTPLYQLTGDDSTTASQGGYLQMGYFLPFPGWDDKVELVARVGGFSNVAGGQEGTWEYAAGVNYYIQGQKVKLQADVTKIYELPVTGSTYSYANVNDDALIWRLQLQVAF
jgi:hypothetical protein